MPKYRRIAPWPSGDIEAADSIVAPDRSEGVIVIDDDQPDPPNATPLADFAAYTAEKARIKAIVDAYVPPPDPLQAEIDWAKGVLTASDAVWLGYTEAQFRLGMKRILRLYGRMILRLSLED